MERKFLKIFIGIIVISLCLIFYVINTNSTKHIYNMCLEGKDSFWKVYLDISFEYDSELTIRPKRDDFKIPSEISIDIIVDNNCIYTDKLEYIPDPNGYLLGKYTVYLDSKEYFKRNIKEANIIIRFNDESSTILLD